MEVTFGSRLKHAWNALPKDRHSLLKTMEAAMAIVPTG